MRKLLILGTCLLLLLPAMASAATAELYVGDLPLSISFDKDGNGNYIDVAAGSIDGSTLDGDPLAWLYCVDLSKTVTVNSTYAATTYNTKGEIYDYDTILKKNTLTPLNNKEGVTWLLDRYAKNATTPYSQALQAAIWSTIYGRLQYDLDASDSAYRT